MEDGLSSFVSCTHTEWFGCDWYTRLIGDYKCCLRCTRFKNVWTICFANWSHEKFGFRLLPGSLSELQRDELASHLAVHFPAAFRNVLTTFDLGHFTIGPIAFCNTGDYTSWLRTCNSSKSAEGSQWWGSGYRPSDLLLIANSDPFAVLLDCASGEISVFHHDECCRKRTRVARSFEFLMRGLGTVWLLRSERRERSLLAQEVAQDAGDGLGLSFWEWFSR
jgi:hypothetical protein